MKDRPRAFFLIRRRDSNHRTSLTRTLRSPARTGNIVFVPEKNHKNQEKQKERNK
jgi:hypothetical protein